MVEKRTFEQRPEEEKEGALWSSKGKAFWAEAAGAGPEQVWLGVMGSG